MSGSDARHRPPMDSKPLCLIAAADEALGIGRSGRLPWELPNEFSWFVSQVDAVSDLSKKNMLIWGRGSAVSDSRPLPHCYRVCLSTTLSSVPPGTDFLCRDLASAVQLASLPPLSDHIETIWVLGGTRPFQEALRYPNCDRIYLTNIMANFHCDTFFPDFDQDIFQLQDKFPGVSKPYATVCGQAGLLQLLSQTGGEAGVNYNMTVTLTVFNEHIHTDRRQRLPTFCK